MFLWGSCHCCHRFSNTGISYAPDRLKAGSGSLIRQGARKTGPAGHCAVLVISGANAFICGGRCEWRLAHGSSSMTAQAQFGRRSHRRGAGPFGWSSATEMPVLMDTDEDPPDRVWVGPSWRCAADHSDRLAPFRRLRFFSNHQCVTSCTEFVTRTSKHLARARDFASNPTPNEALLQQYLTLNLAGNYCKFMSCI